MIKQQATAEASAVTLEPEPQAIHAPTVTHHAPPSVMNDGSTSPLDRIVTLLERGITAEQIDKYLEVQRKHEAEEARRAYVAAMVLAKAEMLSVEKTKRVYFTGAKGTTDYKHATLDNVVEAVVPALARYGFSHHWSPSQDSQTRRVTLRCTITHQLGHSESVELWSLPDDSGNKNPIQAVGSAIKYLERYTLMALAGVSDKDQSTDDDGRSVSETNAPRRGKPEMSAPKAAKESNGLVTSRQVSLLKRKIDDAGVPEREFFAKFDIGCLEDLHAARINEALEYLRGITDVAP